MVVLAPGGPPMSRNIPVVSVIWQYTGLSAEEMEQRVTTYSQYSISTNVTGIKNMEARLSRNLAT
jgi:multidrug efflux pump subunit AcrB